jgi:hypothetical protein
MVMHKRTPIASGTDVQNVPWSHDESQTGKTGLTAAVNFPRTFGSPIESTQQLLGGRGVRDLELLRTEVMPL